MFSHIMLGANDLEASRQFYDAALGALGHKPGFKDERGRYFYITDTGISVSYTHLRAHETVLDLVCRLLLEKKK